MVTALGRRVQFGLTSDTIRAKVHGLADKDKSKEGKTVATCSSEKHYKR
jgi:hypothetical protein